MLVVSLLRLLLSYTDMHGRQHQNVDRCDSGVDSSFARQILQSDQYVLSGFRRCLAGAQASAAYRRTGRPDPAAGSGSTLLAAVVLVSCISVRLVAACLISAVAFVAACHRGSVQHRQCRLRSRYQLAWAC